jgi:hypothetical protein
MKFEESKQPEIDWLLFFPKHVLSIKTQVLLDVSNLKQHNRFNMALDKVSSSSGISRNQQVQPSFIY